jgi:hypothetical protein
VEAALAGPDAMAVQVLHGLGGIGKSAVAAHYAAAHAGDYNPVWWISADSAGAVEEGLAGLAAALQPELAQALPLDALCQRASSWLAAHDGWLLVLDDVSDLADIAPVLDRTLAGRVIITTRLGEGWHRIGAAAMRLEVLGQQQAASLLTRIAAPGQDREAPDGAAELCRELGCLPLAIEQAAGYLHQTRITPRAYLELLAQHPADMLDQAARGTSPDRAIARIWRVTLDQLAGTVAGLVLQILAWYAPDAIPRSLLLDIDPGLLTALGSLAAYNMISLSGDTISVHPLVQTVARTPDPSDPHRQPGSIAMAREMAIMALVPALPYMLYRDPASWPAWRALLPHIDALAGRVPPATDTIALSHVLSWTGVFLQGQGAAGRAVAYHQRALAGCERIRGTGDPGSLACRSNLATAYADDGNLNRAIPLHESVLAGRQRALGEDHPQTLMSRSNLASALREAGDLGRAIPLAEQALAGFERVLGSSHPATVSCRDNLAVACQRAGDPRAVTLHEQALEESARVLGEDHPDTLITRGNLAYALQETGDLQRALPLFEHALAASERVLGSDHPTTLCARSNLAVARQLAGDHAAAVRLLEQLLADCERVLGVGHSLTMTVHDNLSEMPRNFRTGT